MCMCITGFVHTFSSMILDIILIMKKKRRVLRYCNENYDTTFYTKTLYLLRICHRLPKTLIQTSVHFLKHEEWRVYTTWCTIISFVHTFLLQVMPLLWWRLQVCRCRCFYVWKCVWIMWCLTEKDSSVETFKRHCIYNTRWHFFTHVYIHM